jgi:hypothetical protein
VIKRYHAPATPYERALTHPKLSNAIKRRLRETYRSLDPLALLAEIRRRRDERSKGSAGCHFDFAAKC